MISAIAKKFKQQAFTSSPIREICSFVSNSDHGLVKDPFGSWYFVVLPASSSFLEVYPLRVVRVKLPAAQETYHIQFA